MIKILISNPNDFSSKHISTLLEISDDCIFYFQQWVIDQLPFLKRGVLNPIKSIGVLQCIDCENIGMDEVFRLMSVYGRGYEVHQYEDILICKSNDLMLMTNDEVLKNMALAEGVHCVELENLSDILGAQVQLYQKKII